MKEVGEVPSRHLTSVPVAHVCSVVTPVELHAHHSEDEDDDAEDEGEVGERPHRVHHDRQDVVQRLPGLRQLEHPNEESVNGGFDYFYEDFLTIKRFPERFSSRKIAMILQRIKHCRHQHLPDIIKRIRIVTSGDGRISASKVRRLLPRAAQRGRAPRSGSQNSSNRPGKGNV